MIELLQYIAGEKTDDKEEGRELLEPLIFGQWIFSVGPIL